MFMFSNFMFIFFYSKLLMTLISVEFMMLSLLILLFYVFFYYKSMNLMMYYLIFVVCEGVLGLSLLILLIRSFGNNNMYLMNLILW
uniref:NADH dehydrogenase subunit 4L n=1 Tax=Trichogramma japonicum TaxID=311206 RepID=A0A384SKE9_9HYME|nr:NADH dehydrogenase subunit 4L [Trichogramma japonicum]AOM68231.1 NADH dehydrogenase subunit 4L [Trichogramma japonicum]